MRFAPSHLAVVLAAAAATAAVSGFLPSGTAEADHDSAADLRKENKRLRAELQYYQSAVDEAYDGLERIDRAAGKIRDRRSQRAIDRIVTDTRGRMEEYLDGRSDHDYYDGGYGNGQFALDDTEVAKIVDRIQQAGYADDQLALVQEIARTSWLAVEQVVTIMKACSYEDTRIEVAVALYPRIVDPHNWYLVNDGFSYSSSKSTLRQRLGQ